MLCERYDLSPSKKYGQNYLISQGVIENIVASAGITAADTVVEVGPGFGVLTLALAERAKQVIAFEIEQKLRPYWAEQTVQHPNIEIVWGNALSEFDRQMDHHEESYKVVANLPYQITSKIIRTFLEAEQPPTSMTIMVQKEVAERIVARPGDMSLLALSVQYYGRPKIAVRVPKGNFWPMPKVDSAVLHIEDIQSRSDTVALFRLARAGFASKRKQLWSNLVNGLALDREQVKQALIDVVGDEKIRAEALSVADWEKLTGELL